MHSCCSLVPDMPARTAHRFSSNPVSPNSEGDLSAHAVYFPAGQAWHPTNTFPLYPGLHTQSLALALPSGEKKLSCWSSSVSPISCRYLKQLVQEVDLEFSSNFPA